MDNLTHSLVGAAIAESGPRDRIPLAVPTLLLAANAPDIDILSYLVGGEYAALAWRRGLTHGVPALVLWPFVTAGLMLAWDRAVRRRRRPDAAPARFAPLAALAALGAATHPFLDWLNTYGMRWWLPFDGRWAYGDAVFIIDPWLWLVLGGSVFLARSGTPRAMLGWAVLGIAATAAIVGTPLPPAGAKVAWAFGLLALVVARVLRRPHGDPPLRRFLARSALTLAGLYVAVLAASAPGAEREAWNQAAALGHAPVDVMTGPKPARLLTRDVIVRTPDAYHTGTWRWGGSPRLELDPEPIPLRAGSEPIAERALRDPRARHFLTWSRYPYVHARDAGGEWIVIIGDARYVGRGSLGGVEVRLPR